MNNIKFINHEDIVFFLYDFNTSINKNKHFSILSDYDFFFNKDNNINKNFDNKIYEKEINLILNNKRLDNFFLMSTDNTVYDMIYNNYSKVFFFKNKYEKNLNNYDYFENFINFKNLSYQNNFIKNFIKNNKNSNIYIIYTKSYKIIDFLLKNTISNNVEFFLKIDKNYRKKDLFFLKSFIKNIYKNEIL